jgi:hypothetical protein
VHVASRRTDRRSRAVVIARRGTRASIGVFFSPVSSLASRRFGCARDEDEDDDDDYDDGDE